MKQWKEICSVLMCNDSYLQFSVTVKFPSVEQQETWFLWSDLDIENSVFKTVGEKK